MKTKDQLIAFENEVAARFNAGKIRAPVHLYWGNEENIIRTLAGVRPQDWIFCSWRSHYQCLLKGVPEQQVMDEIEQFDMIPLLPGAVLRLHSKKTGSLLWTGDFQDLKDELE